LVRIREVDEALTAALQTRVVESHPEVCFWATNSRQHLLWNKKKPEGREERRRLLHGIYGASLRALTPPRGAAWDDLYDACVLAWTASRLARGVARRLPEIPEYDARGLQMEIVY
jgi:predicted RNase H-like nuclease